MIININQSVINLPQLKDIESILPLEEIKLKTNLVIWQQYTPEKIILSLITRITEFCGEKVYQLESFIIFEDSNKIEKLGKESFPERYIKRNYDIVGYI